MKELIKAICEETTEDKVQASITVNESTVKEEALSIVRTIISETLKIPTELVEDDYPLDEYGIDSMLNLEIIKKMETIVGSLPKTLFFEYNTIEELASFFVKKHYDVMEDIALKKQPIKEKEVPIKKEKTYDVIKNITSIEIEQSEERDTDIAIIGVSGRYPNARNLDEFWENLKQGKDCITEIPEDRWDSQQYFGRCETEDAVPYLKEGGFIDGVYEFDPLFFSIAPNEAKYTDPQDRLFLQCCYETLEDAGYTKEKLKEMNSSGMGGNVGVFAGVMWEEYQMYGAQEQILGNPIWMTGYPSSIANKVSYFFNLHGPSMAVDTMCSSSLTALHLACQSLRDGECDAAIVGGVNLSLHPNKYFLLCHNKFASTRGRCESFGDKGDGYVPGEGVGAVMLKPLKKAMTDGDQIYGVIKATAVNHGGKTSGYTVPNPNAQASVIETVFKKAGINPRTVSYIESHGTGTKLGDPIEIAGLNQVFEKYTDEKQFCSIGSVKSNIGHLEGAAGIVSLTKVLLQMKHKKIVPSLHSTTLNPFINFVDSPFTVPQKLMDWELPIVEANGVQEVCPRRACISSFGAGGSNAHVLVEEYVQKEEISKEEKGKTYAIILSARSEEQLNKKIEELYRCVKENYTEEFYLKNIAYMLQTGREDFNYRLGFCASNIKELLETLKACSERQQPQNVVKNQIVRNVEMVKYLGSKSIQEQISYAMATKEQKELVKLWLVGATINWEELYTEENIQKISLPTYPFARDIYCGIDKMKDFLWGNGIVPTPKKVNVNSLQPKKSIGKVIEQTEDFHLLTFEQKWVQKTINMDMKKELKIVCFAQDASFMQTISNEAALFGKKIELIWILCGEQYEKKSSNEYVVEYEQKEDYIQCFKEIKKEFGTIDNVLYLSPLNDKIFQQEVFGLISILQALYAAKLDGLQVLIAGAYENLLEKAYVESLIGMDKSVAITQLNVSIGVILADSKQVDNASFLNLMLKECFANTAESIWYEDGVRKALKVLPVEIKEERPICIGENGTYLITGGMGGLGILFATHMSEQYKANIILTGRRSLDEVSEKLEELRQNGMKVIYVSADVSNEIQLKQVVEEARCSFGNINGVIHAAGLSEGHNILEKEYAEYQKIIKPKVQGTLALEKALAGENLDFMCYFSSSSAILGDFGSFDYAVGNYFLLSYGKYRRQQKDLSGETYVIEWPLWKDGGMGFKTEAAERMYLKTSGQKGLTKKEGTRLFDTVLKSRQWECLAFYGIEDRIYKMFGLTNMTKETVINETVKNETTTKETVTNEKHIRKEEKRMKQKETFLSQYIMSDLKDMIYDILGVPFHQMDENLNLADFGFDSVTLSKFARRISEFSSVDVTPDLFYRYATLNELVQYFDIEHTDAFARLYQKEQTIEQEQEEAEQEKKEKNTFDNNVTQEMPVEQKQEDSIAIVGISGRFPDADNTDELWNILKDGKEVIKEVPVRQGWEEKSNYKGSIRMGVMNCVDEFDPAFFEISPKEACFMDPRQRILLEETWRALEEAGIGDYEIHNEKIGMFVGAEDGDYQLIDGARGSITANHNAILAARLAYFLNLNGPNMCINTACSSGLVAVHQACQSLRTGECDIAIVAGVNMLCTPAGYIGMEEAGMLSKSKKCYAFDKRADGMVPAEAVAVVVLKKMSKAKQDSNSIYGEIIASGINYDGRTNGITAPSGKAQSELLEDVYKRFNVNPQDIDYIVTHGTGTRIGDPIEINALSSVFKKANVKAGSCALTSTKPNIGHALAASGVVSLISLALALKNEMIPQEINCEQLSDYINWEESPFYINNKNRLWKDDKKLRVGAVNAFGMSGTNAHVVVRSVRKEELNTKAEEKPAYLLALSAKTEKSLLKMCKNMLEYLKEDIENMSNISYTLMEGRQHFAHRIAFVVNNLESACHTLQQVIAGKSMDNCCKNEVPRSFKAQGKIQKMVNTLCRESRMETDKEAYKENLSALAQFYCMGYEISGYELFEPNSVAKVSVPAYPFEHKKYWIPKKQETKSKTVDHVPEQKQETVVKETVIKEVPENVVAVKTEKPEKPVEVKKSVVKIEKLEKPVEVRKTVVKEKKKVSRFSIEEVMKELAASLANELFMDVEDVEYDKGFMEMGLDSIVGVEWMRHINKKYQTNIESTKIYQYPTLVDLAEYILSLLEEVEVTLEEADDVTQSDGVVLKSLSDKNNFVVDNVQESKKEVLLKPLVKQNKPIDNIERKEVEKIEQDVVKQRKTERRSKEKKSINPEEVMKELAASLADELFMDVEDVEYDKGFMEMGLDSIVGVEWMRHINKKYHTDIESTKIYQYPTLVDLAEYILSLLETEEVTEEEKDVTYSDGIILRPLFNKNNCIVEDDVLEPKKEVRLKPLIEQNKPIDNTEIKEEKREQKVVKEEKIEKKDQEKQPINLEEVMKELAVSLANELFMDVEDVEYDKGFMEMGLDSIVGVEWMRHINKKYHTDIESTKIYQYPTIVDLAGYIGTLIKVDETELDEIKVEETDLNSILYRIYQGEIDIDSVEQQFVQ